jgi:MFS family permease
MAFKRTEKASVSTPISITQAQVGLTSDQAGRQRRYLISMLIRTACFILTIFLPSPYRWVALGAAMILPYLSVVIANAGRETINRSPVPAHNKNELPAR